MFTLLMQTFIVFKILCKILLYSNTSVPIKANQWITRRVDLFNENVKQKRVPKRLRHFLNYYLEPDGNFASF